MEKRAAKKKLEKEQRCKKKILKMRTQVRHLRMERDREKDLLLEAYAKYAEVMKTTRLLQDLICIVTISHRLEELNRKTAEFIYEMELERKDGKNIQDFESKKAELLKREDAAQELRYIADLFIKGEAKP